MGDNVWEGGEDVANEKKKNDNRGSKRKLGEREKLLFKYSISLRITLVLEFELRSFQPRTLENLPPLTHYFH